ncbi:MAG: gamma-glutamyl-gamma-aminobutyrate hydrolase family protein [Candidatus Nanohaloarchaea archaeon]|nr:gamma-glutamyl-gamma-aminobutyrate hydrolase family protein [Candidatus Nanohaloarchaea archaeon]
MDVACLCPTDTFDYSGIIEGIVRDRTPFDASFSRFKPHDGGIPERLGWDAVVVTGSEHHVYDEQRWVKESRTFLRAVLRSEIPVLGICYGHQLLADTLGGAAEEMAEREMGYRQATLTDAGRDHPLFDGVDARFTSFFSHLDRVAEPPEDAVVLAENGYGIQAFAVDALDAYGIQFHPEYSREMAEELLREKEMDAAAKEAVRATFTDDNVAAARESRRVFDNFFGMV